MKNVISKELLNEVLNDNITHIFTKEDDKYIQKDYIVYIGKDERRKKINIHELAHKCKEWALSKNYCIISAAFTAEEDDIVEKWEKGLNYAWAEVYNEGMLLRANTEPEAIFKAYQWVYKKEIICKIQKI